MDDKRTSNRVWVRDGGWYLDIPQRDFEWLFRMGIVPMPHVTSKGYRWTYKKVLDGWWSDNYRVIDGIRITNDWMDNQRINVDPGVFEGLVVMEYQLCKILNYHSAELRKEVKDNELMPKPQDISAKTWVWSAEDLVRGYQVTGPSNIVEEEVGKLLIPDWGVEKWIARIDRRSRGGNPYWRVRADEVRYWRMLRDSKIDDPSLEVVDSSTESDK